MAQKTKPKQLVESTLPSISASKVDREKGIIYGVRLGGLESKNKRRYTEACYKSSLNLYEGKPCNINHVAEGEQVQAEDRFGIWHNARWSDTPAPGPVADLHYIKAHPMADRVCEAAERADLAAAFGMSHIALPSSSRPDGEWVVVEGFEQINSVDLVADAATVGGLFKENKGQPMKKATKALIESALNTLKLPFQQKLYEKWLGENKLVEKYLKEEIETPDGAAPAEILSAGFNAIASAAATDSSLTPDESASQVKAAKSTAHKMLNGEDETPVPVVKPDETPTKKESTIGVVNAGVLCESMKFTPNIKQLTLISESTEPLAKQLAEEFYRLSLVKPEQEPTSAGRVATVSESTQQKPASNAKELAERIR